MRRLAAALAVALAPAALAGCADDGAEESAPRPDGGQLGVSALGDAAGLTTALVDIASGRATPWIPGAAFSSWSPDGRTVAATALRDGEGGSTAWVVLSTCGRAPRRLTDGGERAGAAVFSPDGARLAWVAGEGGPSTAQRPDLVLARAGGGERSRVKGAGGNDLSWSPDGSQVASEWSEQIAVVDVAAGRVRTVERRNARGPAWRADGALTYYQSQRGLAILEADATRSRTLVPLLGGRFVTGLDWSPDGERLAYAEHDGGSAGQSRIVVVDADGGGRRVLHEGGDRSVLVPRWSPDGGSVAFLSARRGAGELPELSVMLVPAGGGEARPVSARLRAFVISEHSGFDWRPKPSC